MMLTILTDFLQTTLGNVGTPRVKAYNVYRQGQKHIYLKSKVFLT